MMFVTVLREKQKQPCLNMICMVYWFKILRDGARHFSNQRDIYQAAKVVPKNWSDNHCNWSVPGRPCCYWSSTSKHSAPFPVQNNTHPHAFSHCVTFCFLPLWEPFKKNDSQYIWPTAAGLGYSKQGQFHHQHTWWDGIIVNQGDFTTNTPGRVGLL